MKLLIENNIFTLRIEVSMKMLIIKMLSWDKICWEVKELLINKFMKLIILIKVHIKVIT